MSQPVAADDAATLNDGVGLGGSGGGQVCTTGNGKETKVVSTSSEANALSDSVPSPIPLPYLATNLLAILHLLPYCPTPLVRSTPVPFGPLPTSR